MEKKIVAIIQARMGSSRLPNKVLTNINGTPLLEIILRRLERSKYIDSICIATTENDGDDRIERFAKNKCVECFRGSESNVLDRYYNAALKTSAEIIVRITADDPLKEPEIIDLMIKKLINMNVDYISNTICPTYPEGLDCEVFTFQALEKAFFEARLLSEREHVTPYIWKNTDKFKTINIKNNEDLSHMRWTIDKEEDLLFFKSVFEKYHCDIISCYYKDLISFLKQNPSLLEINSRIVRNEGYLKSVEEEENEKNK